MAEVDANTQKLTDVFEKTGEKNDKKLENIANLLNDADARKAATDAEVEKKDLKKIEKERETQSLRRQSEFRVSLVGYTNAGKSTLFKALTGSNVYIQDQLFATLDTTIRKLNLDTSHTILLSDTVGFLSLIHI